MSAEQRSVLVDKFPDAANVAAGALVFGQFLGDRAFSAVLALAGLATWAFFIALALILAKGDRT